MEGKRKKEKGKRKKEKGKSQGESEKGKPETGKEKSTLWRFFFIRTDGLMNWEESWGKEQGTGIVNIVTDLWDLRTEGLND